MTDTKRCPTCHHGRLANIDPNDIYGVFDCPDPFHDTTPSEYGLDDAKRDLDSMCVAAKERGTEWMRLTAYITSLHEEVERLRNGMAWSEAELATLRSQLEAEQSELRAVNLNEQRVVIECDEAHRKNRVLTAQLEAADALADAVHLTEKDCGREWQGDYYDVTCRFCGTEWNRRVDEHHERRCPIPDLRESLATYRRLREGVE